MGLTPQELETNNGEPPKKKTCIMMGPRQCDAHLGAVEDEGGFVPLGGVFWHGTKQTVAIDDYNSLDSYYKE